MIKQPKIIPAKVKKLMGDVENAPDDDRIIHYLVSWKREIEHLDQATRMSLLDSAGYSVTVSPLAKSSKITCHRFFVKMRLEWAPLP